MIKLSMLHVRLHAVPNEEMGFTYKHRSLLMYSVLQMYRISYYTIFNTQILIIYTNHHYKYK